MDDSRLSLALSLAKSAGALLLGGLGRANAKHKGAIDLVTEHDVRSERLLIEGILHSFPSDAILSEESGGQGSGEICWVLDPLDATTNFAHGLPHFCVSIACWEGHRPSFGVVFDPTRSELFHAISGAGAWLNGQVLHVSSQESLNEGLLATGFPYDIRSNPDNNLDQFAHMARKALALRRFGSAALDLAYVAAGRFDAYWELATYPWDWAAGSILVQEAGGRVTTIDGQTPMTLEAISILASNGLIHDEVLQALDGAAGLE